jgi:hypothetical protein
MYPEIDSDDHDWFQGIAAIWARDYDPREDIYTLDDGEPISDDADEGPFMGVPAQR